jgi:hypothetical protein
MIRSVKWGRIRPYWVTFEGLEDLNPLKLGVGVTGHNCADVESIIVAAFGPLAIRTTVIVEDVATLDQGYVRPNMGSMFIRGIWFPLGYEPVGSPNSR